MQDDPNRKPRYDQPELVEMLSHGRGHGEMFVELYLDAALYGALTVDRDVRARPIDLPLPTDVANQRVAAGFMGAALALLDAAERYQEIADHRLPDGDDKEM